MRRPSSYQLLHFNGRTYSVYQVGKFLVPETLMDEVDPWIPLLQNLPALSDDPWIVSSVRSGIRGDVRLGTSHCNVGAIDLAPILSLSTPINPSGKSPLLFNNRLFGRALRDLRLDVALYLESDHIHVGFTNAPGVYFYKDYTKYKADGRLDQTDLSPKAERLLANDSTEPCVVLSNVHPYYTRSHFLSQAIIDKSFK